MSGPALESSTHSSNRSLHNVSTDVEDADVQVPSQSWRERLLGESGMGVVVTALFIVGEMAGGGIVTIPQAFAFTSWTSIPVVIGAGLASAFTGVQLGECWAILQRQWPLEFAETHTRKPYPSIARKALGPVAAHLVSLCIDATLFGVATVFLLLASRQIETIIKAVSSVDISFCVLVLIVAAVITPLTWLGSPKNFWFLVVGAMGMTGLATVLILVGAGMDGADPGQGASVHGASDPVTLESFFIGFATIVFAFGGHAAFPTIQHDMREPRRFGDAITIAYGIIIVFLYLPVGLTGWQVYGQQLNTANGSNVTGLLSNETLRTVVAALITLHVLLSFVIVMNPLTQEVDELLHLPKHFCWQRVASRSGVMLLVVFVAETVPNFGAILSLIGGSF